MMLGYGACMTYNVGCILDISQENKKIFVMVFIDFSAAWFPDL